MGNRRPGSRFGPFVGLLTSALVVVASCYVVLRPADGEPGSLQSELAAVCERVSDGGTIDLATVVPLEWDRAYVFGAYTSMDDVRAELGFDWSYESRWSPLTSLFGEGEALPYDGTWLVVLVDGRCTVAGWALVGSGRSPLVWLEVGDRVELDRTGAHFRVRNAKGGAVDQSLQVWTLSV
jgi:hypothetical protein